MPPCIFVMKTGFFSYRGKFFVISQKSDIDLYFAEQCTEYCMLIT